MIDLIPRSLGAKLVAMVVVCGFTVVALLVTVGNAMLEGHIKEDILHESESIGSLISASLAPSLLTEDVSGADELVNELLKNTEDILYIRVDDRDDRIFALAGKLRADAQEPVSDIDIDESWRNNLRRFDFPITLGNELVGHGHVGLSLDHYRQLGRSVMFAIGGVGVVGVLVSMVAFLIAGLAVTKHLRTLDEAAQSLSRGDFSFRWTQQGDDEVHRLGRAFEAMGKAIAQRNLELQNESECLRKAVSDLERSKSRERELRYLSQTQRARSRALLGAMNVGILFETLDSRVDYMNPAFEKIWGIESAGELTGTHTDSILKHSAHQFVTSAHASRLFLRRGRHDRELGEQNEIQLADGRVITQQCYPVQDNGGRDIGHLWIYEDVTRERQTAEQLIYLAERDSLTGLLNRHRFQSDLDSLLKSARRFGRRLGLLFFDLDEFKYINDNYGHNAGDTVLTRIASELRQQVREGEILARLGGDEFAVITNLGDDATHARAEIEVLANRIAQTVAKIPFRFRGRNIRVTTSIGISLYPDLADDPEVLISQADAAMYQAKQEGKNTWSVYDAARDRSDAMATQLSWSQRIEKALEENLFELHFQGIFHVKDRALSHLEALLRLRSEEDLEQLFMPGQFIPPAEKTGKIMAIDLWVLSTVIGMLGVNPHLPPIAVNISGRSLDNPALAQTVAQLLSKHAVEPERLIIELTETAAVSDIQDAQRFIEALHAAGVTVCLDDFGAGFSSFSYLKHITADVLKIDGQFITDLPNNPENRVFLRAILDVAKGMNKRTVAEFVDSPEVLQMLSEFGVDMAQGYFLEKPRKDHPALTFDGNSNRSAPTG